MKFRVLLMISFVILFANCNRAETVEKKSPRDALKEVCKQLCKVESEESGAKSDSKYSRILLGVGIGLGVLPGFQKFQFKMITRIKLSDLELAA